MPAGAIFALDIGVRLGVAVGAPGYAPVSFSVRLKKPSEPREVACGNLIAFLQVEWTKARPAILFKEAPPALQGFAQMGNSEATVRLTYGLHAIAEAMAARFGIPWSEKAVATIRKHSLGAAGRGERAATKRAVIARGVMLGYLPKDCRDDNRGDAVAAWSWAETHIAHRSPATLVLFGEEAAE